MFKRLCLIGALLLTLPFLIGATREVSFGHCVIHDFTDDNVLIVKRVAGYVFWDFEPDAGGSGSGTILTFEICHNGTDANTCTDFNFRDTNSDGIGDTNTMDGVSSGQRGLPQPIVAAGDLRITASSVSGTPQLSVCAID